MGTTQEMHRMPRALQAQAVQDSEGDNHLREHRFSYVQQRWAADIRIARREDDLWKQTAAAHEPDRQDNWIHSRKRDCLRHSLSRDQSSGRVSKVALNREDVGLRVEVHGKHWWIVGDETQDH